MKTKPLFLHTLNGKPANYEKGGQINIIGKYSRCTSGLATSHKQIRREQKASRTWRRAQKWFTPRDETSVRYDHVKVYVPAP